MKKRFLTYLAIIMLFTFIPVKAEEALDIHLFYLSTCTNCSEEMAWLDETYANDSRINIKMYEISDKKYRDLFEQTQVKLNTPAKGVPYLVIGDQAITGFIKGTTDIEISKAIERYLATGTSIDPFDSNYQVPILGEVDIKEVSLPLLAGVMGVVDGFNPCAMWVLVFLITLLINLKDRKRMWILGLTFIFISGLIYYLFMFAWLNVAMILNSIPIIQIVIALVSIGFALYQIRQFFNTKDVGCEVIDDTRRKTILTKVKKITSAQSLLLSLMAIISLAILVNLFELMCSLGLPVIFTQILSLNELSFWQTQFYLLIYILFFLIDDIIIFSIAMLTLKIKPISGKYMKYSHLIGGVIMLVLGLLMLFKPEILMFNF